MKSWTEFHIGVVYYSGLTISMLIGIISLLYLKPFYYINKIAEKSGSLWSYTLITTLLIAGILGAMSVSFTDCSGNYDFLLNSRSTTISRGISQITKASMTYAVILGVWCVLLLALRMHKIRPAGFRTPVKIALVLLLIVGIVKIYSIFNL